MLQEISRTSIVIGKNDGILLSWQNSILTVRTDKGIHLYEFSHNLQCIDKKLDFIHSFIPTPKKSCLTELIPSQLLTNGLNNIEYTELILDPGLWAHNDAIVQEMTTVSYYEWSPPITSVSSGNVTFVLAVLNNMGNIFLYNRGRCSWICVLEMSKVIEVHYLASKSLPAIENYDSLKATADMLVTTALCFSPTQENVVLLCTAQRNGHILFWVIGYYESDITATFVNEIQTDFGEISKIIWVSKSETQLMLICSNVLGQIYSIDCCKIGLQILNKTCLWSQKDRMISQLITYTSVGEDLICFYNKNRHLLVQMIDSSGKLKAQVVKYINDYKISDITSHNSNIYLTTVNCKLYQVIINNTENLDVECVLIENNDPYATHELFGISFSNNNVITALALMDRKVMHRKEPPKIDIIFCIDSEQKSEVEILFRNPTEKLTDHWDCISLLQYKIMKTKAIPSINFHELYNDADVNLYKLKLYFIFLTFINSLKIQAKIVSVNMPETSLEVVREKIFVAHACQLITQLFDVYRKNNKLLVGLEYETYLGAKSYLSYYCTKYKKDIIEFATRNSLNIIDKLDERVCQCCDEILTGFSCKNGHLNMFCSLTFTLIEDSEYLVCPGCNCTARIELYDKNPMCLFCDLYLSKVLLPY